MQPDIMILQKVEPDTRAFKYYSLSISSGSKPDDWQLKREWGRIGKLPASKTSTFPDKEAALKALEKLQKQKLSKGYQCTQSQGIPRHYRQDDCIHCQRIDKAFIITPTTAWIAHKDSLILLYLHHLSSLTTLDTVSAKQFLEDLKTAKQVLQSLLQPDSLQETIHGQEHLYGQLTLYSQGQPIPLTKTLIQKLQHLIPTEVAIPASVDSRQLSLFDR